MQDVSALVWVSVCVHTYMVPLLLLRVSIFNVLNISTQCRWFLISACTCNNTWVCTVKNTERLFDVFLFLPSRKLPWTFSLLTKCIQGRSKGSGQEKPEIVYSKSVVFYTVICNLCLPPKVSQNCKKFLFFSVRVLLVS